MLKCYGGDCPIKEDCYRYTQPYVKRNAFGSLPYDFTKNGCEYFHSNIPTAEQIRTTAYYIWLREGKPENRAQQHWQEAYESLCRSTGRIKEED